MQLSDRAIERRAKKYLLRAPFELFVPTLPGLEQATKSELVRLGYSTSVTRGGVGFQGDLASAYEVNLSLHSGNRVLLRLGEFLAQNYPMLYNHARSISWEAILGNCPSYAIHVSSRKSRLGHRRHVEKVICDAIRDRMNRFGLRPTHVRDGQLTISARLHRDRCLLSLDTSGPHLHKRGYRQLSNRAPIRETTAAGILLFADSESYQVVVDPFCGSGTFPIEAELLARNAPPGINRQPGIECSPLHSPGTWQHQLRLASKRSKSCDQEILGLDISADAISKAKSAARAAGTTHVSLRTGNALELDFRSVGHQAKHRLVVANLPYGRRLGSADAARNLIEGFSRHLSYTATGWDYALITPRSIPPENPALHTTRTVSFENGGIPVLLSLGTVRDER